MLGPNSIVVRDASLVFAPLGEEIAMLDVDSGNYYVLDDVAAAIWESLADETTCSRISATLIARYEVPPAQCEADVLKFLETLHAKGLINIVR